MNPTLTNLTIHAALDGKQEQFDQAMREQHWAGGGGKGADIQPRSWLDAHGEGIIVNSLEAGVEPADLRRMASRLRARHPGDRDVLEFADYAEAAAAEAEERFTEYQEAQVMEGMAMTTEMMEALRWDGIPLREQRTLVDRPAAPDQHPRQYGWANYPTNVRPQTIDDREARGARPGDLPLSARILDAAREMAQLANAAKDTRQRNRIAKYASYLRQAYARQLEREDASAVAAAADDANAEMDKIVNDAARDSGDGDHAEFRSFDDWDDEPRAGSDDASLDDVDAQLEDVPHLPPGKRVGEDQLSDPSLHADDVPGRRKNAADDDIMVHLGKARRYAGKPGTRYSAFGKESLRESGGDLTDWLLGELDVAAKSSHSFF